jgi:hypothetical protein
MRSSPEEPTSGPEILDLCACSGRGITWGAGRDVPREVDPFESKRAGESKTVPSTSNNLTPRSRATSDV